MQPELGMVIKRSCGIVKLTESQDSMFLVHPVKIWFLKCSLIKGVQVLFPVALDYPPDKSGRRKGFILTQHFRETVCQSWGGNMAGHIVSTAGNEEEMNAIVYTLLSLPPPFSFSLGT